MSRRKQSKPRQIKRPFGEMEEGNEAPLQDSCPSEKEGSASDREGDSSRSPWSEKAESRENLEEPDKSQMPEIKAWTGPDELDFLTSQAENRVCAKRSISSGASWGPFPGNIHSEPPSPRHTEMASPVTLILQDDSCWLAKLCLVPGEGDANSVIYKKDDSIWCKTTKPLSEGDALKAFVMAEPVGIPSHAEKTETGETAPPVALPPEIQLLPQQAGMAAILATAVVNKDVFPCKDCGIWYRSERNLQAHLMYYCASRQNAASPAVEEKPKELYPNERVCPFPQCQKSCPSASSLEIHLRSHSGERPFVCLICLSAFTTKANCERHLKVHTDTLNGVCHNCGFISTTRDILYSHLVTSHMVCQPGSKGEVYSPGPILSASTTKPLAPGLSSPSSSSALKCSFCGFVANCSTSLQQHVVLHEPPTAAPSSSELNPAQQSQPDASARSPAVEEAANGSPSQERSLSASLAEGAPPIQVKEEPVEEGEATQELSPTVSATSPESELEVSSPHSLQSVTVKSEITSPMPGSSPVPREPGPSTPGGTLFLPQYMFGHEAAGMPQASEILAKMSELVHSRLKQGHGAVPPTLFPGAPLLKGATCFECEITFNNINNYYVHKRLYCSSRRLAEDSPPGPRKVKPAPATTPKIPNPPGACLSPQPPGDSKAMLEGDAERGATPPAPEVQPEVKVEDRGAKGSPSPETEGSQSPGSSSLEEPDDDPNRTVCDACNIRFSRHETYVVHKRYYCASRHDPPLRRPSPAGKLPFLPQPIRTRKRRKLYEIHGVANSPGATPEAAPVVPALISMVKASPSPSSSPDAEGPIDLSKKPRLHNGGGVLPPSLLPLADYHECTACRISFHSLSSYLAHKKYYCPATPLRQAKGSPPALLKPRGSPEGLAEEPDMSVKAEKVAPPPVGPTATPATFTGVDALQPRYLEAKAQQAHGSKGALAICPYCPLNGTVKGDLADHFRSAHGLLAAKTLAVEASQAVAEGSLLPPLPATPPPQPPPRPQKDSKEAPVPLLPNSSPRPAGSPQPLLPLAPSEPPPRVPAQTPEYTDKGVQTSSGKGLPNPVANGSHRFCRLCNIKFSSLSTFIAHKKYYCSSHAAEHVK